MGAQNPGFYTTEALLGPPVVAPLLKISFIIIIIIETRTRTVPPPNQEAEQCSPELFRPHTSHQMTGQTTECHHP